MLQPYTTEQSDQPPLPAGTLQLIGTAEGIQVSGPGGQIVLSQRMIEQLAEFSVALLDVLQPDPEREPNGDETDGDRAEDEAGYNFGAGFLGIGCPISDPDFGGEEAGEPEDEL